jgi:hypothetical protein
MLHSKWCLIYEFIDNGLSDQKLAMLNTDGFLPLSEEEFNKMLEFEANYKPSEYIEFFRFFSIRTPRLPTSRKSIHCRYYRSI